MADAGEKRLIPVLPDDVAWQCLARISHGFEGVMQCVCKRWRDAFRSEEIGRIRTQEALSGDWLFVHTRLEVNLAWQAYDPAANRWHPLPHIPGFCPHMGFRCAILNRRLLFLGGLHGPFSKVEDYLAGDSDYEEEPSNRMFCFDPFFRKWAELPGMRTPRAFFACGIIDGRVIVAGGDTTLAEIFDPGTNTWEPLPEMPESLDYCHTVTHEERFHVFGYAEDGSFHHFILNDNEWNVAPPTHEVPDAMEMTEVDGQLYGIQPEGLAVLDETRREWRILCGPPDFGEPYPEQWIPPYLGFMGLNGRFYLAGGTYYFEDDEVNFTTVYYCNPSAGTPIDWHEARTLLGGGGNVFACASLSQE